MYSNQRKNIKMSLLDQYTIKSIFSVDLPTEQVIIAPVLTPHKKSNNSCVLLPVNSSNFLSISITKRPLVPPPSMDKILMPLPGKGTV